MKTTNHGKKGFTLAEVLITLAIIGTVAALTIPSVVHKIQEQQLKAQFKKAYSNIYRIYSLVIAQNGASYECYNSQNDAAECTKFYQDFTQKLKTIKYCANNALSNGCVPKYAKYYSAEGGSCTGFWENRINNTNSALILADGSIFIHYTPAGSTPIFAYDINGMKKPNKWGYDLFPFYIVKRDDGKGVILDVKPQGTNGYYQGCAEMVSEGGRTTEDMLKWAFEN